MRRTTVALLAGLLVLAAPCHAGTFQQSAKLAGFTRTWLVHLPKSYKRGHPVPLVIAYHGRNGTPQALERSTRLDEQADRLGFIVVYPTGVEGSWNLHGFTAADAAGVDGIAFATALLDRLELNYSIDPKRIVLAGFSDGGNMVNWLGCRLADRVTAIVPIGGTLVTELAPGCKPSRPLTVIEFHGSADLLVPFAGAYIGPNNTGLSLSVEANIAAWAARDRCAAAPRKSLLPGTGSFPPVQVEDFAGCPAGTQVRLYEVMGGAHTWPSGQPVDASLVIGQLAAERKVD